MKNKIILSALLAAALLCLPGFTAPTPQTWYVGADGGTRYDATLATEGQCDGKADVAYSGTGTNQHCRFNDMRYLWTAGGFCNDGTATSACWKWVIAGGDTAIVHNCIQYSAAAPFAPIAGSSGPCGIGSQGPGQSDWGMNLAGDNNNGGFPVPPSGTASQHTRILGANYASCTAQPSRTQVVGTYGVGEVFKMEGVSYVDTACFDISDQSSCGRSGQASACSQFPWTNYGLIGIGWSNTSTNDTVTDVRVHGMAELGMYGPTGDGVVMTRVDLIGNAGAGWNADKGDGQTGVGSLLVQNFNISWNGCGEQYPIVDPIPYTDCQDDSSGGYGDGFGTATMQSPAPGWQIHFDQGIVSYNTQDGLDALHLTGPGSSMTITRTLAYGNEGQQIKIGGANGTAQNNIIYTNCNATGQPIPGTPKGFGIRTVGSDFCRASDAGVVITAGKGSKVTFDNNTIYSASATGIEFDCDGTNGACDATSLVDFRNNIFVGFLNNLADGYTNGGTGDFSNPIYNGVTSAGFPNPFTNPGSVYSNNLTFHPKSNWTCPQTSWGETKGLCTDPQLTDSTWHLYDTGNVAPVSTTSAVVGAGLPIPGLTTDFFGNPRSATKPTIGAVESTSSTSTTPPPPPVIITPPPVVVAPPPVVVTPPPVVVTAPPPATTPQPVAIAANMVAICAEGYNITAFSVPTFTAQFGTTTIASGFEPTFTFGQTLTLPFLVWYTTPPLNAFDPAPSLGKMLYAQKQSAAYTITCSDSATPHAIAGLAVVAPPPPVTSSTVVKFAPIMVTPPSVTCTSTLSADGKTIATVCK